MSAWLLVLFMSKNYCFLLLKLTCAESWEGEPWSYHPVNINSGGKLNFTKTPSKQFSFFVLTPTSSLLFLSSSHIELLVLMQHFLFIIQQYPVNHCLLVMLSLSMAFTQTHSLLVRLIASATLTFIPTMAKFNPDAPNFIHLTSLIVEFDVEPIWILSLGTFEFTL